MSIIRSYHGTSYKFTRIGFEWMIGDDSDVGCNAIGNKTANCPLSIEFPGILSSREYPKPAPVAYVGRKAFFECGRYGKTVSLRIPKEVRIIRSEAFRFMDNVRSFELEECSQLEEIHFCGIDNIGWNVNSALHKATLVLPSSLRVVEEGGLYDNFLFMSLVYCGQNQLLNDSWINRGGGLTKFFVTKKYQGEMLLNKNLELEKEDYQYAEEICVERLIMKNKNTTHTKLRFFAIVVSCFLSFK